MGQNTPDTPVARFLRENARRAYAEDVAAGHDARMAKLRERREQELAEVAARVRAATCPTCFLVKTPTGRCDCTEG